MPRTARLDIPGLLHHVIVRGIERRSIFADDHDRQAFVDRFSFLLQETETSCLAWSLMTNHLHLLLRPEKAKLSIFMRRLLTGYAVNFNLRHNRCGHLFQNRYKSLLCDEETYFLELIRYVHLNPLRAGVVSSLEELDCYPWCGHAVLLGNSSLEEQCVDEILHHFGQQREGARQNYRSFIADGVSLGTKDPEDTRGLRRWLAERIGQGEDLAVDGRILGSEDFCAELQLNGQLSEEVVLVDIPLVNIMERVASLVNIPSQRLLERTRTKVVSDARALFCCIAVRKAGHNGAEVGRLLGLSRAGVSVAAKRGEGLLDRYPKWRVTVVS